MPRARPNLTLDAIWDLEDQHTALAGSASGRTVAAQRAGTAAVRAPKAVSPKKISRAYEAILSVTKSIKTGLPKSKVYGVRIEKVRKGSLSATKPNVARAARVKTKAG